MPDMDSLYLMRNGYSSGTIVTVDGGSVLV
jgi:hypothetical protein